MKKFFDMDNGLFRFLTRLADLMILNLTFIVCCLPVFTIGASATALYYVTLKMAENEEGYIFKGFLKSFRQNFRQATVIWLIMICIGCILGIDYMLLGASSVPASQVFKIVTYVSGLVFAMVLLYVFPVLAKFDNTIPATIKNAAIFSIIYLPKTAVMLAVIAGSVILTIWNSYTFMWGLLIWIMLGFSIIAFINSKLMMGSFSKFINTEESGDPDHWTVADKDE